MKKNVALCAVFALLTTFAFPPFRFGFLAFFALIPLFLVLENKSPKEAFRWTYFAGLMTNLMLLYWIGWATIAGAFSAILVLPAFLGVFALLHTVALRKLGNFAYWLTPIWWTGLEWLKTLGQTAFPWFTLGYSQSYYFPLIQFSEYVTVYGVSCWIVLLNVLVFFGMKRRQKKFAVIIGLLIFLPFLHGKLIIPDADQMNPVKSVRVGLVQGNIDPFKKWKIEFKDSSFVKYGQLTAEIAQHEPDLIVWPETATPGWLKREMEYLERVRNQVDSLGIPLLTGTPDYRFVTETEYRTFNTAVLILPHRYDLPTYEKMQLVPFGERIPYEDSFPFTLFNDLLNKLEMGQGNFSPGSKPVIFSFQKQKKNWQDVVQDQLENSAANTSSHPKPYIPDELFQDTADSIRFGVAICYESVFPQIVRRFVTLGADFQLVITNDAWFGRTSMPFQHLQYAVFRAIENRTSVARCTNGGISGVIDPYGRVSKTTNLYEEAIVVADLPVLAEKSFYVRHGNLFPNAVLIIFGILTLGVILIPKRGNTMA